MTDSTAINRWTTAEFAELVGLADRVVRFQASRGRFGPGGAFKTVVRGKRAWVVTESGRAFYLANVKGRHGPSRNPDSVRGRRELRNAERAKTPEPEPPGPPSPPPEPPSPDEINAYFETINNRLDD